MREEDADHAKGGFGSCDAAHDGAENAHQKGEAKVKSQSNSPSVGSSFDDFLEEEGIRDDVLGIATKRVVTWELARLMKEGRVS